MNASINYNIQAVLWRHKSAGGWYFVTIPQEISKEIRDNLQWQEEGWGRMKASAIIKEHQWDTAIWFDTRTNSYVLPIKAQIRKKLSLEEGDIIDIRVLV